MILGDWISDVLQSNGQPYRAVYTFEDSLCSQDVFGDFAPYRITNDTLAIFSTDPSGGGWYKIVQLTSDTLHLLPVNFKTKRFVNDYGRNNIDTLFLQKVRGKNSVDISKIYFTSTGCFFTCPSMKIEIDSSGNIKFWGEFGTIKEGGYAGILQSSIYSNLVRQIQNINLDSLKTDYRAGWTDDQTCCIQIKLKNRIIKSCAYGYDKEPVELRILFHKLLEIYKMVDLKENDKIVPELEKRVKD